MKKSHVAAAARVHHSGNFVLAAKGRQILRGKCFDEFEQLRETAHRPAQTAGPGGEAGIALLGAHAAESAVGHVKDGFMRGASAHVVDVASFAVENAILRGGAGMDDQPPQQRDHLIALAFHHMSKLVRQPNTRSVRMVSMNSECGPLNDWM